MGCSQAKDGSLDDAEVRAPDPDVGGRLPKFPGEHYPFDENVHGSVESLTALYTTKKAEATFRCMRRAASVPLSYGRDEKTRLEDQIEHLEQTRGPHDPRTISAIESLAQLLQDSGRHRVAEKFWRRAVDGRVTSDGGTHPLTLKSVSSLAAVLVLLGKHEEAEWTYRQNLRHLEALSGPKHPSTLDCMESLALLLETMGRYHDAEQFLRRALEGKRSTLGPLSPEALASMNMLARLLQATGRAVEAETLLRSALESDKATAEEQDRMFVLFHTFAAVLSVLGKHDEAERLYWQAWTRSESRVGSTHPQAMTSLDNFAGLLQVRGKHGEAEQVLRRSSEERRAAFGPTHPATLTSFGNLAALLVSMGRYVEAEKLYRSIAEGKEAMLGATHPETLAALDQLVGLLQTMGCSDEARRRTEELGAFPSLRRACPSAPPPSARSLPSAMCSPRELRGSPVDFSGGGGIKEIRMATPRRRLTQDDQIPEQSAHLWTQDHCSPRRSRRIASAYEEPSPRKPPRRRVVYKLAADEPVGILFDDNLCVDAVYENSQAAKLGIKIGWRACSVNSESVINVKQFMTNMQALHSQRGKQYDVVFEAPKAEALRTDARQAIGPTPLLSLPQRPDASCSMVSPRVTPRSSPRVASARSLARSKVAAMDGSTRPSTAKDSANVQNVGKSIVDQQGAGGAPAGGRASAAKSVVPRLKNMSEELGSEKHAPKDVPPLSARSSAGSDCYTGRSNDTGTTGGRGPQRIQRDDIGPAALEELVRAAEAICGAEGTTASIS